MFSLGCWEDCPLKYLRLCLAKPNSKVDLEVQLCSLKGIESAFLYIISLFSISHQIYLVSRQNLVTGFPQSMGLQTEILNLKVNDFHSFPSTATSIALIAAGNQQVPRSNTDEGQKYFNPECWRQWTEWKFYFDTFVVWPLEQDLDQGCSQSCW